MESLIKKLQPTPSSPNTDESEAPAEKWVPCKNKCGEEVLARWDTTVKTEGQWVYAYKSICSTCEEKDRRKARLGDLMARAGIMAREMNYRMENFPVIEATRPVFSQVSKMLTAERPLQNFFIWGLPGRGKTRLAVSLINSAMEQGATASFLPINSWLAEVRRDVMDSSNEIDQIDTVLASDFIVVDDFGAHKSTEWSMQFLDLFFDKFYRMDRGGLIVTCNFDLREIAKNFSDRIASRIREMCERIEMPGQDWRCR